MNVREYFGIINWFDSNVAKSGILEKYRKMQKIITSNNLNAKAKNSQLNLELEIFYELISKFKIQGLNQNQIDKLSDLGISSYVTSNTSSLMESLRTGKNVVGTQLQVFITNGVKLLNEVNTDFVAVAPILEKHLTDEVTEPLIKNIIRISLKNGANIKNVADLEIYSKKLSLIFGGISSPIKRENTSTIRLVNVKNGSVILDFVTTNFETFKLFSSVVGMITGGMLAVAKLEDYYSHIKKNHAELLVAESETILNNKKEELCDEILKELKAKKLIKNGDQPAVKKAIENIKEILDLGADIEFLNIAGPGEEEVIEISKKLSTDKIEYIEYKKQISTSEIKIALKTEETKKDAQ